MRIKPSVNAIFATDTQGGMGLKGTMPWPRLPGDMRNFRKLTSGNPVIMGRSTWDSDMPTPLPHRSNIVITNRPYSITANANTLAISGLTPQQTLDLLVESHKDCSSFWIIGGANILVQWLPLCDHIYHTLIEGDWHCDVSLSQDLWIGDFELDPEFVVQTHTDPITYTIKKYQRTSHEAIH